MRRARLRRAAGRHVRRRGRRGRARRAGAAAGRGRDRLRDGAATSPVPGVTTRRRAGRDRRGAAGDRGRRQPDRRLADPAGRHRRGQRLGRPRRPRRPAHPGHRLDLRLVGVLFYRNGVADRQRRGRRRAGQPGPLRGLAGQQARRRWGRACAAATSCCPGALHRMVPVRPGDVFQAEFAHLGTVTAQFGEQRGGADDRPADGSPTSSSTPSARRTPVAPLDPQVPVPRHGDGVQGAGARRRAPARRRASALVGAKLGLTSAVKRDALGHPRAGLRPADLGHGARRPASRCGSTS